MSETAAQADDLEAALARVEDLGEQPLADHATAFERVHELLQRSLGEVDG